MWTIVRGFWAGFLALADMICYKQAGYDASVQGPAMPYAAGEWTEYPQPPPEQYAGPWPPEQYAAYVDQYANPAVSAIMFLI